MNVSCVVPTHDRPRLLLDALASVVAQTDPPFEVVVVDDSPGADASVSVDLAAAAAPFPVRVLHHPAGTGASSSRNAGARASAGDVLAFLDDDDWWAPSYLARAHEALRRGHAFVVTWLTVRDDRGRTSRRAIRPGLVPADALALNPGVTGSNLVVRREAFEAVGGFDEGLPVSNDRDLFIRLLDAGFGYGVVAEPLVVKRAHPGPRLATAGQVRADGYRAFLDKHRWRMTRRDRRMTEAKIARVVRASASGRGGRLRATLRLVRLAGPSGLGDLRSRRLRARRRSTPVPNGVAATGCNAGVKPASDSR